MKDLRDAVVVITGAGSGIGRATALAFARQGARLHLVDLDLEAAEVAALEAAASGGSARAHRVDCADAEAVERLAEDVFELEGRVDVLLNNAGVCLGGPAEQLPLEDWQWIMDVNFWGVVHGVRAFVPRMIEAGGGGHVVNTASMAGLVGLPMVAPYCASKFAVVGLSEALHAELAVHDVHVTVVCPGATRTNVLSSARLKLPGSAGARLTEALGRWAKGPEGLAEQIVEAVRRRRSFVASGPDMLPLWWLHRLSTRLYLRIAHDLTSGLIRRWG